MAGHVTARVSFAAVLVAATLTGLMLRLQDLGTESFWSDELTQLEWTDQPLGHFLADRWQRADPPLNELIAWTWNNGLRRWAPRLGADEAAIRAPVVLFGVLTIPAIGLAAAAAFGRRAGVLAALVLATNPHHVRYSQDARMYPLTVLLSTLAVLFLVRTLRDGRRRDALAFGTFAAAASYAHFFAFLSLAFVTCATLGVILASTRGSPAARWRSAPAALRALAQGEWFGLALFGPYLVAVALHVWRAGRGVRPWLANLGAPGVRAAWSLAQSYGSDDLYDVVPVVAPGSLDQWAVTVGFVSLTLALMAGMVMRRRGEPHALRLHLVVAVVGPPLLVFAVSRLRPIYSPRYLLSITPALVLLCVRPRSLTLLGTALAVPIAVGAWVQPRYHRWLEHPEYREAVQQIAGRCEQDDVVRGTAIHRRPIQFYMRRLGGHCETYVLAGPADRRGDLMAAPAESPPGGASNGQRTFTLETVPFQRDEAQRTGPVRGSPSSPDGVERQLIFRGNGVPTFQVWLEKPGYK